MHKYIQYVGYVGEIIKNLFFLARRYLPVHLFLQKFISTPSVVPSVQVFYAVFGVRRTLCGARDYEGA
jgi:hypothetical protein